MGLVVLGSISAVFAHTYRLEDTSEFILADDDGKRTLVVTRGTTFRLGVLDTSGCAADIRAVRGNKRVVSVSNPKSPGLVEDHIFEFTARRVGTTTYDVTVRGEAFGMGDPDCDEDSVNPIVIQVVDPRGSEKDFARAIRPEIRNTNKLFKQLRANYLRRLAEIRKEFQDGDIDVQSAFLFTTVAMSAALFEQVRIAQDVLQDMQDTETQRIQSDPVLSRLPVANGLMRGGCGSWDRLVDDLNDLIYTGRTRSERDLKKHLARILREYERGGGRMLYTADFGRYKHVGGAGIDLENLPAKGRNDGEYAVANLVLAYACADPLVRVVNRGVFVGGRATSGVSSVRAILRDGGGDLATQDTTVSAELYFALAATTFGRTFGQQVFLDILANADENLKRTREARVPQIILEAQIIDVK